MSPKTSMKHRYSDNYNFHTFFVYHTCTEALRWNLLMCVLCSEFAGRDGQSAKIPEKESGHVVTV